MNNNEFDNLTRKFGKGVSRRDALKLLFLGALSAVFPLAGVEEVKAATQSTCSPRCPIPPPAFPDKPTDNIFDTSHTCLYVENIANNVGVASYFWRPDNCKYDLIPPGESTPPGEPLEYGGITPGSFDAQIPAFIPDFKNPKPSQWTAKSPRLQFSWIAITHSYKLEWDPCCIGSNECATAYKQWQDAIDRHEQRHADEYKKIANETNNNEICYRAIKSFKGTGDSQASAEQDLCKKIQAEIDRVRACMADVARKRDLIIDADPAYKIPHLDCTKCPPGQCNGSTYCAGQCCGPDQQCINGACQSIACPDCMIRNPNTGVCEPVDCGDPCLVCQNNSCQSKCDQCSTCSNGVCVSTCDECMHCENGICVRTCTDTEVCCGGQCIDPSQYNCCITTNNGSSPCLNGSVCCASGECCDPAFGQCCGGACVPYSAASCTNCFACSSPDQVCCTSGNGSVYGCCDANQICDPAHGCVAAPL